jgi:hypothetical protein
MLKYMKTTYHRLLERVGKKSCECGIMEEVRELSSEVCLPMSSNIEERLGKAIGGGL